MSTLKGGSRPPWVGLGASVWLQIASGNAYNFPLYSHSLKSVLGFNQHQLTMLGVANDIGENVGIIPGLASNKFPPWVILFMGGLCCFFGYGVLWLAVSETVQTLPYWLLWLALCIATNSSAWLSTAVLVTNMRNFPISRGTVAGILKGYGGLSAAVFTEIYSVLLHKSASKLLFLLSAGVPILCFVMMYFVRPCVPATGDDSAEALQFLFIQYSSVILGMYLLSTTIINNLLPLSHTISCIIVVIMVLLLMAPLAIPVKMTLYPRKGSKLGTQVGSSNSLIQDDDGEKNEPFLRSSTATSLCGGSVETEEMSEVDLLLAEGEGAVKKKRRPRRGEDFTFMEAVIKADFWLLFLVFFVGVGSGVTVLNNLAQIGIAQGVNHTTILLSIFSCCNFAGRLGGGVVSEHFVRSKTIPRTVWMTCTQAIMTILYLLFGFAIKGTLYPAVAVLGICYGVQFSIMIPTVSELFGLKHFGIFFNIMSMGNPLGALLFSGLLAGCVYDNEAAKQHGLDLINETSITCFGPDCFKLTFLVLAGVCAMGTVLSVILNFRIKPVYQTLYAGGSFRLPSSH